MAKMAVEVGGHLGMLMTIVPEEINSIREDGWEELEFAVDSGASETVVGPHMIFSAETRDGPASRRGVCYEVANGIKIANQGEKRFLGTSEEGVNRSIKAQVCDVNKGLLSVRRIVKLGHKVIFDANGSYIQHVKSGERMRLVERKGMYMLKLWTRAQPRTGF